MGYTHYWYREKEIERETFKAIVDDFRKLVPVLEREGVPLAGGDGYGEPVIDYEEVWFNGKADCGHKPGVDIFIAWPTPDASGVGSNPADVDGQWFAGRLLRKRCCNGDCSHETFWFPRVREASREPLISAEGGKYFDCCKTAFKPYDWAVTAFLVIAKHYLKEKLVVKSDGTPANWHDARILCQVELGYGMDFELDEGLR